MSHICPHCNTKFNGSQSYCPRCDKRIKYDGSSGEVVVDSYIIEDALELADDIAHSDFLDDMIDIMTEVGQTIAEAAGDVIEAVIDAIGE